MTRNQNLIVYSRKRIKTCDIVVVSHWSDLNHDVLYLVMMKLGAIDFVSFSGVYKSWRSLALDNRKKFMASRPPMLISISTEANEKENNRYCHLEDLKGRKFKTIIPHSFGRRCVGSTCGYLILFGKETNDLWLMNLITRHQLHFPDAPVNAKVSPSKRLRAALVFSPSISEWVFVISNGLDNNIWFSRAGKGAWNHVSSSFPIHDLIVFKGKIYALNYTILPRKELFIYEIRLDPQPILTLLETKNFLEGFIRYGFVSSGENLYLMECAPEVSYKVYELDFSQMKWMLHKKTCINEEYTFFLSSFLRGAVVKPESRANLHSQYMRHDTDQSGNVRANTWYFPNDSLNVNLIHE